MVQVDLPLCYRISSLVLRYLYDRSSVFEVCGILVNVSHEIYKSVKQQQNDVHLPCVDICHRTYMYRRTWPWHFAASITVAFGHWMESIFLYNNNKKTFFDTGLHEVSWHFATGLNVFEVQLTEWGSVSQKPFKMGFCFYPKLRMRKQPPNSLKTVSKVADLSSTIAMTAHYFGALCQVRAIGHCVIGQECDLICPDWLNWWMCPWFSAFEIKNFLIP